MLQFQPRLNEKDLDRLIMLLSRRTGVDLTQYKREQLRRRLLNEMRRQRLATPDELLAAFGPGPDQVKALLTSLTINVTEANRDPDRFHDFIELGLRPLLHTHAPLRIWSAGCSYGAEPISVAIFLHELDPQCNFQILGTDLDPGVLERARQLLLSERDVKNLSPALLSKYFSRKGGHLAFDAALGRNLRFRMHNLLNEPFPREQDVILFRNVAIYFRPEATERIHAQMAQSLKPGGVLFVGATELVRNASALGLEAIAHFIYRKS